MPSTSRRPAATDTTETTPRADHRAAAVRLITEAESRTGAILSGVRGELTTSRVLADRVRTEHDLTAATVHQLVEIGDAIRDLAAAIRGTTTG